MLSDKSAVQLVHSLVSSCLDYCNSLLYGLPDSKLNRLQRMQNIAARIITRTPKSSHITPILKELHWLPIKSRILFKILLLTYRALHGLAPQYLAELLIPYQQTRSLRSANQHLLTVPKTRLKTYGERCFMAAAAYEWNSLPIVIKTARSLNAFKSALKTHLFKQCYD